VKSKLLQMRADLVAAQAEHRLVRVRRSLEPGSANGYVVNVGPHFFSLLFVSDLIIFDGFRVFRIRDLSSVEVPAPHASFVETALRLRAALAPPSPPIDLADLPSLLTSASAAFPVITVHREIDDPDVCHIGVVQKIVDGTLTLKTINPDGLWDNEPVLFDLPEITRVDFGGLYEQALTLVVEAG
jgi:hypothetical protein